MAIKNLYTRCVATAGRSSIPRLKDKDAPLLDQLDFFLRVVQDRVIDLGEIVRDFDKDKLDRERAGGGGGGGGSSLLVASAPILPIIRKE